MKTELPHQLCAISWPREVLGMNGSLMTEEPRSVNERVGAYGLRVDVEVLFRLFNVCFRKGGVLFEKVGVYVYALVAFLFDLVSARHKVYAVNGLPFGPPLDDRLAALGPLLELALHHGGEPRRKGQGRLEDQEPVAVDSLRVPQGRGGEEYAFLADYAVLYVRDPSFNLAFSFFRGLESAIEVDSYLPGCAFLREVD